jgi:hypothetical protein
MPSGLFFSALIRPGSVGATVVSHTLGTFSLTCATTKAGVSTFCVFDPHSRGRYDGATFFFFDNVSTVIVFFRSLLTNGIVPIATHSLCEQPPQPQLSGTLAICTFTPENPHSPDLAWLVQSSIQSSIENLALRAQIAELARQIENKRLKRTNKKDTKKLDSALGLEFTLESNESQGELLFVGVFLLS